MFVRPASGSKTLGSGLRAALGACALIALSPAAQAVSIDGFGASFPSPGTLTTDASGTAGATQSPLSVLGGTRIATLTTADPSFPATAQIMVNTNPPPNTDIIHMVTSGVGGGSLRLDYPQPVPYDLTLGTPDTTPTVIEVRSTLMTAGTTIAVTLEDSGGDGATRTLTGSNFVGEHIYSFYVDPTTFNAGGISPDFGSIDLISVTTRAPHPADTEISDISVIPVLPKTIQWQTATTFQLLDGVHDPLFVLGFEADSPTTPTFDLSDPMRPVISYLGAPPPPCAEGMPCSVFLAFGSPFSMDPSTVPEATGFSFQIANDAIYRVQLNFESSSGEVFDGLSLVGFNPQPEPPIGEGHGYEFEFQAPMGFASTALADESVSIAIQIFDQDGVAQPIALVAPAAPALSGVVRVLLIALMGALGLSTLLADRLSLSRATLQRRGSDSG